MKFLRSEKLKYVVLYVGALSLHLAVVFVLLATALGVDLNHLTLATLL